MACPCSVANYTAWVAETRRTHRICRPICVRRSASMTARVACMPTEPELHLETPPGLLALARERMRTRHLALRTEQAYLQWLERYVAFHHRRHPRELGAPEIERFLTH